MKNCVTSWLCHALATRSTYEVELIQPFFSDARVYNHSGHWVLIGVLKLTLSKDPGVDSLADVNVDKTDLLLQLEFSQRSLYLLDLLPSNDP